MITKKIYGANECIGVSIRCHCCRPTRTIKDTRTIINRAFRRKDKIKIAKTIEEEL